MEKRPLVCFAALHTFKDNDLVKETSKEAIWAIIGGLDRRHGGGQSDVEKGTGVG